MVSSVIPIGLPSHDLSVKDNLSLFDWPLKEIISARDKICYILSILVIFQQIPDTFTKHFYQTLEGIEQLQVTLGVQVTTSFLLMSSSRKASSLFRLALTYSLHLTVLSVGIKRKKNQILQLVSEQNKCSIVQCCTMLISFAVQCCLVLSIVVHYFAVLYTV